jgi:hypothetical protein
MSDDAAQNGREGLSADEMLRVLRGEPSEGEYRLLVRSAPEVMSLPEPDASSVLLGPFVFQGARTIVVGDTGHGKTSFALQMLATILHGDEMLGYRGAGRGPVMVVDLEQGIRSIKRGLRESQLAEDDGCLHVSVPDGLALDQDADHVRALATACAEHAPIAVLLDPYYKAHRADEPNAARPVIDLMRILDALRTVFGFALILPAHPRKDVAGARDGARKLSLHDVAGSGALTWGVETVLAVERMGHGYARLRYLKDRDGDLPIGDSIGMLYDKATGFHLDPRSTETDEGVETLIGETEFGWATTREWAKQIKATHVRVKTILEAMATRGLIAYAVGPDGRSAKAKCYSTRQEHLHGLFSTALGDESSNPLLTVPGGSEQSRTLDPTRAEDVTVPLSPPVRGERAGNSRTAPADRSEQSKPNPLLEGLDQ